VSVSEDYPDHVHIGNENNVFASKSLNIIELIEIIEKEADADDSAGFPAVREVCRQFS